MVKILFFSSLPLILGALTINEKKVLKTFNDKSFEIQKIDLPLSSSHVETKSIDSTDNEKEKQNNFEYEEDSLFISYLGRDAVMQQK